MAIVASADQFLRLGLELVGFPDHQFVGAATNMVRWSSHFAVTPTSMANLFYNVQTTDIPQARLDRPVVQYSSSCFSIG
jgi:hypothetical protein